jgi:peptide/nickel transport system permease protein
MRALATYLLYRLATHVIPLLVGVSIIVFAVVRLIPGDAVDVMNDRMPIEQRERIRLEYGLDQPIWTQYALWMGQVLQGNLGASLRSGRPVMEEIGAVAVASMELGLFGALIGIGIGLPAGILAALHHKRPADSLLRSATYVSISVPEFWLGAVLILTLGIGLGVFPVSGYESVFVDPGRALHTGFMPALALGLIMAGFLARVTRSAMLEVMRQEYVVVARAKGLPPRTVVARHALSNAAPAIVTVVALQFAFLISGSIVIEEVFVRPGLGRLLVRSIFQRDYAVVQAITLLYTTIFIVANLAADVLRAAIDPRLRQS